MLSCISKIRSRELFPSLNLPCIPHLPQFKPAPVPQLILGETIQFNLSNQTLRITINSNIMPDPNWICGSHLTFTKRSTGQHQYGFYIYMTFDKQGNLNSLGVNQNGIWNRSDQEKVFSLLTHTDWDCLRIEKPYHGKHQFNLCQPTSLTQPSPLSIDISVTEPIAAIPTDAVTTNPVNAHGVTAEIGHLT